MKAPELDLDFFRHNSPNMKLWLDYTEPFFSPDSYRILGWLFTCGGALQRRVWFGSLMFKPLFVNPYMLFIGPMAVGKGLVQDEIPKFYEAHKDPKRQVPRGEPPALRITLGPHNLTYERAVESMAQNTLNMKYADEKGALQTYVSSPMAIVLPEAESLFKQHAEAVGALLRQGYDCIDHKYETKTQGRYYVKNTCVALCAGTQPSRLPKLAKLDAFTDGMASRCILAFESTPRHSRFHLGEPPDDVLRQYPVLVTHVGQLCGLFGKLQYPKTTYDYLESYFQRHIDPKLQAAEEKLQSFYARWRANCLKLAAAFHFSDSMDLVVGHRAFEKAIKLLEYLEKRAVIGLSLMGKDDSSATKAGILRLIQSRHPQTTPLALIVAKFASDVKSIDEIVDMLKLHVIAGTIVMRTETEYMMAEGERIEEEDETN